MDLKSTVDQIAAAQTGEPLRVGAALQKACESGGMITLKSKDEGKHAWTVVNHPARPLNAEEKFRCAQLLVSGVLESCRDSGVSEAVSLISMLEGAAKTGSCSIKILDVDLENWRVSYVLTPFAGV